MFEAFLSRDMTYSCAIFPTLDADVANMEKGDRLLENGVVVKGLGNGDASGIKAVRNQSAAYQAAESEDELYEAQMIKLRHLVQKLKIPEHSGMLQHLFFPHLFTLIILCSSWADETIRVLEIGSGWGALAILLTQTYPFVEVDSLTLSSEQVRLVLSCAQWPHRIDLLSYRKFLLRRKLLRLV
jgi:cyclopropane-fatty-acyl-phospholipid synthase